MRSKKVAVIDIFAGAGGLGEGFCQFKERDNSPFELVLSIEKDPVISKTLELRELWRQSNEKTSSPLNVKGAAALFQRLTDRLPGHVENATSKVLCAELGKTSSKIIDSRIRTALGRCTDDWVLVGGPPCQAYSLAGRSRMRSTNIDFDRDERHFLYKEYLRIVALHKPAVFVIENVPGIMSSRIDGQLIFNKILEDLKAPGFAVFGNTKKGATYRLYGLADDGSCELFDRDSPESFVVSAENYGVPQRRRRVVVVGVRHDVKRAPEKLTKSCHITTIHDVIGNLPKIRSKLSREADSWEAWHSALDDIRRMKWMRTKGANELGAVSDLIRATLLNTHSQLETTASVKVDGRKAQPIRDSRLNAWFQPNELTLLSHESRSHMRSDLHRYLFASAFTEICGRSPTLRDFPRELQPNHGNVREAVSSGMFGDRFRVQRRDAPATTVTSHIAKDGHYFIHYDRHQCRSLTVREAARIQTFPDNYIFYGNRSQQYHQIGNAVPPLLGVMIARSIWSLLS